MPHLFRHKATRRLFCLEEVILDIHHLNCNGFRGIYAYACDAAGHRMGRRASIVHNYEGCISRGEHFDPRLFIETNFEVVAELCHF